MTWTVFPDAPTRANCRVTDLDVTQAIKKYKEVKGYPADMIALNPKMAHLAPKGLELQTIGGCLGFEVWLATKPASEKVLPPDDTVLGDDKPCNNVLPISDIPLDDVTERIKVLAREGKPTRAIAAVLQSEGVKISHMTVARKLQGVLPL